MAESEEEKKLRKALKREAVKVKPSKDGLKKIREKIAKRDKGDENSS